MATTTHEAVHATAASAVVQAITEVRGVSFLHLYAMLSYIDHISFSPIMRLLTIIFLALFVVPCTASADNPLQSIRVTESSLSSDFDTLTLELSEPAHNKALLIDVQYKGSVRGGGMTLISEDGTLLVRNGMLSSIQRDFDGDDGSFRFKISICPKHFMPTARGWTLDECSQMFTHDFTYIPRSVVRALPANAEEIFSLSRNHSPTVSGGSQANVVVITPETDVTVEAIVPQLVECENTCIVRSSVSTEKEGRSMGSTYQYFTGKPDDYVSMYEQPIHLQEGVSYVVFLEVSGSRVLKPYTAGRFSDSAKGLARADFSRWSSQEAEGSNGPLSFDLLGYRTGVSAEYPEHLRLWGPSSSRAFHLYPDESIVLIAGSTDSSKVELEFDQELLECTSVPIDYEGSETNNLKWECVALSPGKTNVYYTHSKSDVSQHLSFVISERPLSPTCGDGVIDAYEQCDSGQHNSTRDSLQSREGDFCSSQCTFSYGSRSKKLPVICQTYRNNEMQEDMLCTVSFGSMVKSCTIKKTDKQCQTEYWMPSNNDQVHYKPHLTGSLEALRPVSTAYNGTAYYLNFDYTPGRTRSLQSSSVSSSFVSSSVSTVESEVFPDMRTDHLSGRAAAELRRRNVIQGYPDGEFKPQRPVNRAEAAKFLLLASEKSIAKARQSSRFPDLQRDQWYMDYIMTAADLGIINGHPDGTFRPADTVNTAEFLKMLFLAFSMTDLHTSDQYIDIPQDAWFASYTGIVDQYDLFPDRKQHLKPGAPLTRSEVATAIYQYLQSR